MAFQPPQLQLLERRRKTTSLAASTVFSTSSASITTATRWIPSSRCSIRRSHSSSLNKNRSPSLAYFPSSSSSSTPPSSSSSFQSRLVLWGANNDNNNNNDNEELDPGQVAGTDLRIVKYPHPALRRPNTEITMEELTGEGSTIPQLAKELLLLMYAAQGVGLAAPQVGVNKRLMVFNPTGDAKKWVSETILINPRIVEFSVAKTMEPEGCLSFPHMNGFVERSKWIKVEYQNLKGKRMKKKYLDWEARIFQHEYDHLDGKVYIDRLPPDERNRVQPQLDTLIQQFEATQTQRIGAPAL